MSIRNIYSIFSANCPPDSPHEILDQVKQRNAGPAIAGHAFCMNLRAICRNHAARINNFAPRPAPPARSPLPGGHCCPGKVGGLSGQALRRGPFSQFLGRPDSELRRRNSPAAPSPPRRRGSSSWRRNLLKESGIPAFAGMTDGGGDAPPKALPLSSNFPRTVVPNGERAG